MTPTSKPTWTITLWPALTRHAARKRLARTLWTLGRNGHNKPNRKGQPK